MIRVMVADDHPIVRLGLRRMIELEPDLHVAAEARDGAEVIELLGRFTVDVLVLDLSLPHIRGLELIQLVHERHPSVRILIFTVQPEDLLSLHMLDAGADGYLNKDRHVDLLLTAIREVAAGRRYLSPALQQLCLDQRKAAIAPHERLSAREREVFHLLLSGMSVSAIAGELEISASTASNHLSHIREKLGVESNGEVLLYASRVGIL